MFCLLTEKNCRFLVWCGEREKRPDILISSSLSLSCTSLTLSPYLLQNTTERPSPLECSTSPSWVCEGEGWSEHGGASWTTVTVSGFLSVESGSEEEDGEGGRNYGGEEWVASHCPCLPHGEAPASCIRISLAQWRCCPSWFFLPNTFSVSVLRDFWLDVGWLSWHEKLYLKQKVVVW